MLRCLKKRKKENSIYRPYFPIFVAIVLSLLFSVCIVHYSGHPFFFVTSSLSVSGVD